MTRSEMLQDVYYWLSGVQLDLAMALRDYVSNNGGLEKSAKKLNMGVGGDSKTIRQGWY